MYYIDQSSIGEAISYNGAIHNLTPIAQGDDVNNRSGNHVRARSLLLNMDLKGNAQNPSNTVRALVFIDKQNTGSAPAVSDVLQYSSTPQGVIAPKNIDHLGRYEILMDRRFIFQNQVAYTAGTASVSPEGRKISSMYRKMFKNIKFTGPAATDIYAGAIYLLLISDVPSNDPVVTWASRVGYNDQ